MFHVKKMSRRDVPFAIRLSDTMNWELGEGDFEFMMEIEPKGCFVLFHDSERVGIVTTIGFGKVGWFGNLIVQNNCRKKGGGTMLASHAIKYLIDQKVETIGLYAYVERIPFYKRLGFEYDSDFIVLKGKGFSSPENQKIVESGKPSMDEIIEYDGSCLGFSRKKLLEPVLLDADNLCFAYVEDGMMLGYVIAKKYREMAEVGPLICRRGSGEVAIELLGTVLNRLVGFEVSMCISESQFALLDMLRKHGFTENFHVARMFHGPPIDKNCICTAESLERG
jgi:GNAT superfamily N-acetyltransferase